MPLGRGSYSVEIYGWDAALQDRVRLVVLDQQLTSLEWDRRLNDTSQANLEIAVPVGDTACCEALGEIRTVHHEVDIFRNPGGLVWSGPITKISHKRTVVNIECKDVTWWLDVRFIRHERPSVNDDLSTIAKFIVDSAFSADDPLVAGYVDYRYAGVFGTVEIKPNLFHYASAMIAKLVAQGLDYTTLGRRIVFGGQGLPFATLPTFTDLTFLSGDGVEVVEDAAFGATRAVVVGAGIHGESGGVDPYFRLVERRWADKAEHDQNLLNAQAKDRLTIRNPVPLIVNTPDNAVISPEADLTIGALVAGAATRLDVSHLCRTVSQPMRLQQLKVTKRADQGEQVGVKLQPLGAAALAVAEGAGETGAVP